MLAGILIAIVVVAGIAVALPWIGSQRPSDIDLEGDPTERFANSMRILRADVEEYASAEDAADVSTPLTRRAELAELRFIARQAAKRRRTVVAVLLFALATLTVLSIVNVTPWWSLAIPGTLLVGFLATARLTVVAMHRSLDARAEKLRTGFDEDEDTTTIDLGQREDTEGIEISVDLTVPTTTGALWDPIPVTPATYVSQPLLPRTVRTIDLSAPVAASTPLVPTADHPDDEAVDVEHSLETNLAELRPRAVGE